MTTFSAIPSSNFVDNSTLAMERLTLHSKTEKDKSICTVDKEIEPTFLEKFQSALIKETPIKECKKPIPGALLEHGAVIRDKTVSSLTKALLNYIGNNDADSTENALKIIPLLSKDDLNSTYYSHISALEMASNNGNLDIVQALVKAGAASKRIPDYKTISPSVIGLGPLHYVLNKGYLSVMEYLLKNGADPEQVGRDEYTTPHYMLHESIKPQSNFECLTLLFDYTKNKKELANQRDSAGKYPIQYAFESGRIDIIKLLLLYGADLKLAAIDEGKIFLRSAENNHLEIIKLFKEIGFPLDYQDEKGRTALHYAAAARNEEVVSFLIESGANPALVDQDGKNYQKFSKDSLENEALNTLKHYARVLVKFHNFSSFEECLSYIGNINQKFDDGNTLLHVAMKQNITNSLHLEIVYKLIENGADLKIKNNDGKTPDDFANEYLDDPENFRDKEESHIAVIKKYLPQDPTSACIIRRLLTSLPEKEIKNFIDEVLSLLSKISMHRKDRLNKLVLSVLFDILPADREAFINHKLFSTRYNFPLQIDCILIGMFKALNNLKVQNPIPILNQFSSILKFFEHGDNICNSEINAAEVVRTLYTYENPDKLISSTINLWGKLKINNGIPLFRYLSHFRSEELDSVYETILELSIDDEELLFSKLEKFIKIKPWDKKAALEAAR